MGYWIKFYTEILDDPKMALLDDHTWRRISELFLLAGKIDKDGFLPETKDIAWLLRSTDVESVQCDLEKIMALGIIEKVDGGWLVKRFARRQGPASPAERKAEQRKRDQSKEYSGHAPVTKSDVDTESDTETETETESEAESAQGAAPAAERDFDLLSPLEAGKIQEIKIFRDATGRFPGRPTYGVVVSEIRKHRHTAEYLHPFFVEWCARGYRPTNLGWLTDWAALGEIPRTGPAPGKNGNGSSASDQLAKMLAEVENGKQG